MSKTYDALLKAQREEAVPTKGTRPSRHVPEPPAGRPTQEAEQQKPPLASVPEITSKKARISPAGPSERTASRVLVENSIAKPDSVLAEQFRKLKILITTYSVSRPLHSVLVTSCMPEEGKTTVALNISATIAKGLDDSVILVDGDLRKRNLTSLLDLQNVPGLSDVLLEKANMNEILFDTEIEGLKILPAGSGLPNPGELVGSIRMRNLLQRLSGEYSNSYVIIDSTPIIATSEAGALSQMVDGIILVIMADATRRDVVKRELKTIDSERILGVVLNCAEFETSDYYHKYYKNYGKGESS